MSVLEDYRGITRERFVETGTYEGTSLMLASRHFAECLSVELDYVAYINAEAKFKAVPNVQLYMGHSPKFLREVLDNRIPTTFWLDAHWDGRALPNGHSQCPLLEELYEIVRLNWWVPPIILIDDADLFTSDMMFERQPGYWKRSEWPTVAQIDDMLPGYYRKIRRFSPNPNEGLVLMYERRFDD